MESSRCIKYAGIFYTFAENKVIMAEENKYNHDSVNELLTWAKDVLDNKKYPSNWINVRRFSTAVSIWIQ